MNPSIAYYISAHGYGHGVRSCDIIRALVRMRPDARLTLISDLPIPFLKNRLPDVEVQFRPGSFDVGMVQLDSIRVDVDATFRKVADLYSRRAERSGAERAFLEGSGIDVVVADIPSIPLEAARTAGLPAIAVGNFAWDWIYEEFAEKNPAWAPYVDQIAQGYGKSDLLLRLPFSEEMRAFPRKVDVPLVASPGRNRRDEIADLTGADGAKKWILLSFTTLDWNDAALAAVEGITDHEFFTVPPLEWRRRNMHPVPRERVPFSDVLASVDAVISKPGFGLLSECVANNKPLIYADRTDFREYGILVREMKRFLRCVHVPAEKLYRGELRESLAAAESLEAAPERLAAGGAEIAAGHIAGFLPAA